MNRAALSPATLWPMIKESFSAWQDDFAPSMGAAIAYYTLFSIAPLLVIVIAIAGFFFGDEAASGQIYAQIAGLIGDEGAAGIQGLVKSASDPGKGAFATIIGVVLLIIGATTVFAELQSDLDRIWKAPAAKKPEGVWGMVRARLLSFGLVVSIGFLLLISMVVSAMLAALGKWWGGLFENFEWVLHILNFVVSFAVITALFALMFKILPRVKISWHDVWIGAFATALLFTIGKFLVGLYLGKSSVTSGFGAAGSMVVLILWVYYSAQIFLLGAEYTWVYAHRFGSRMGKDKPASAKESVATTDAPQGEAAAPATSGAQPTEGQPQRPRDTRPQPARPTWRPAPRQPGIVGIAQRHPGMITGAALLIGALAGQLLKMRQTRPAGTPRALGALAADLLHLRRARGFLRPKSRLSRAFGR
jgi:membrane protein